MRTNKPQIAHLHHPPPILIILSALFIIITTHSITTETSLHNFYSSSIFPHCKLKMKRLHILFPFLLLSLMLVALHATSSTFQQTTTGHFKIASAAYDMGNAGGNSQKVKRNRKEAYEQKLRKTPSGPSPVGNNRPPSKA
ncbi:uncharacterized protein LOC131000772 [Salvia miltiorrhiza]|uniref:uncharacterized protein LOC131000772 n=1 Tax=Salvia miltiorrhiza TaxID=226208 RepID=UPI0025AD5FCC|nr:uncharacterized protein LOC131000772 [Salvia miltiorrhiza]